MGLCTLKMPYALCFGRLRAECATCASASKAIWLQRTLSKVMLYIEQQRRQYRSEDNIVVKLQLMHQQLTVLPTYGTLRGLCAPQWA